MSLLDRIGGALLAALCTLLTALALPITLLAMTGYPRRGLGPQLYDFPFAIWVVMVSAVAGAVGFWAGTSQTIDLLGHLWGTATRVDRRLRRRMIFVGLLLGGVSYAVVLWQA